MRGEFAIAQQTEQVFAGMGQLFQSFETQKAGGPLDSVYGAEDIGDEFGIRRALFQIGQTPLHAVQTLLTFNQKLPRQFVHRFTRPQQTACGVSHRLYRNEEMELEGSNVPATTQRVYRSGADRLASDF